MHRTGRTHDLEAPPNILPVGPSYAQDALVTKAKGTGVEVVFLARLTFVKVSEVLLEQVVGGVQCHDGWNPSGRLENGPRRQGDRGVSRGQMIL